MPELPEVEVLVRHLAPRLQNRVIEAVIVRHPKTIRPTTLGEFRQTLEGASFLGLTRRGKYLLFTLRKAVAGKANVPVVQLLGHLGMSGRLYLRTQEGLPRHAVVVLRLGKEQFIFEDARRFGRLTLDTTPLLRLGPEPLGREFTAEGLYRRLAGSRQAIKPRLMDQAVLAGVGNIYASESLWLARISPRRQAGRLTREECRRLWRAIRAALRQAIAQGSTLKLDFSGQSGRDGLFYYGRAAGAAGGVGERLRVYDRAGEPCPRCGRAIQRIVQAGRSTFWCPRCQG